MNFFNFLLGVMACYLIRPTSAVQVATMLLGFLLGQCLYEVTRSYLDKRASKHKGE